MKWHWRILIIIGLIIIGSFVMTILEINSNWGYLWGFIVFMLDSVIERFCFKKPVKSIIIPFLKSIWKHIWSTAKTNAPNYKSMFKNREPVAFNEYLKSFEEPKPSQLIGELLKKSYEIQMAWYRIQLLLNAEPLSGDISEQSVILKKMDEIADPFAEGYAKSHAARYAILDKVPQRYFDDHLDQYLYAGFTMYEDDRCKPILRRGEIYGIEYIKSVIKPDFLDHYLKNVFKKV